MTAYTIPADLRPWVEREAPTLTVEDWPEAKRIAKQGALRFGHSGVQANHWKWSIGEARALLAYRDEVALAHAKKHARKVHPNEVGAEDWHAVIAERARVLRKESA